MISGAVVNNGVNFGTQAGVSLRGSTALSVPPTLAIYGTVYNNGWNFGSQNGVYIR